MKLYTYLIILIVLRRLFTSKRIEPFFAMCSTGVRRDIHMNSVTYMHIVHIFQKRGPGVRRRFGFVCAFAFRLCHGIVSTHIMFPLLFFQDTFFFSIVKSMKLSKIISLITITTAGSYDKIRTRFSSQ